MCSKEAIGKSQWSLTLKADSLIAIFLWQVLIKLLFQINFALTDITWSVRNTCSSPSSATSYNLTIISESKCFEKDLESNGRLIKPTYSLKLWLKYTLPCTLKDKLGTRASNKNLHRHTTVRKKCKQRIKKKKSNERSAGVGKMHTIDIVPCWLFPQVSQLQTAKIFLETVKSLTSKSSSSWSPSQALALDNCFRKRAYFLQNVNVLFCLRNHLVTVMITSG